MGVNKDQFGRPTKYELEDGSNLDPIFYDDVERNKYGPGIHMDPFGRPVRDKIGF